MRQGRGRWKAVLRRATQAPSARLGIGLATGFLLALPWVRHSEAGSSRLELSAPDPPPTQLIIEPPLLAKLRTLAGGLHTEIALCLFGTVSGDTARLDDFHMPEPTLSTASNSLVRPCPDEALAVWHNHPLDGAAGYAARAGWQLARSAGQARRLCVLSKTDIHTSLRFQHPFVIVGVDRDTWCWWTRDEVVRLAEEEAWPGLPAPGKLVTRDGVAHGPLAGKSGGRGAAQGLGAPD